MAPRNSSNKFFKSANQSSPYSQTAYVGPVTRSRQNARAALMNPMYRTLQNIGDAEVTRPDGSRVLSVRRTAGKNKENLAQRFRDLLMEAYTKPKRSYETQARLNIMAEPKTAAEYQRLSDAVTFMGNMMGDEQRGYLQGKASPPIKSGPTRGSSAMKRMSKADDFNPEYRKKTPLDSAYYPNPNVNPRDRNAPWRMNTYAPNNPYGPGGDPYSAIYGARSFAGAIKDSQELGNWLEGVLREAYKEQNVPYPEFKNKLNGNIYIQGAHSSPTRIDHKQRVEYSLAPTRGSQKIK